MKAIFTFLLFVSPIVLFSQLDKGNLMGTPIAMDLTELTIIDSPNSGSIAYVDSEKSLYLYTSTKWIKLLTNSAIITNELLFQNDDYIYVSVAVNGTAWMVSRYHKNDINAETTALGTGQQPDTLAEVATLTYL